MSVSMEAHQAFQFGIVRLREKGIMVKWLFVLWFCLAIRQFLRLWREYRHEKAIDDRIERINYELQWQSNLRGIQHD